MSTPFQLTDAERVRVDRIDELVARGEVDALIAGLSDASWTVRRAVIAGLASLGDDAVVPLCDWIRYRRTGEAAIAAAVDTLVASRGRAVAQHVTALLHDARSDVAADAATILGRRRAPEAVGDLRRAAMNANDNVALAAIEALGRIGGAGGIDTLIDATHSENFFRVFAAIQVLATIGDPRAVDPLAALVADPMYRGVALEALGRTGSVQAVSPLLAAAGGEDLPAVACALAELVERAAWSGAEARVIEAIRTGITDLAPYTALLATEANDATLAKIASLVAALGTPRELPVLARSTHPATLDAIVQIVHRHPDALDAVLAGDDVRVKAAVLPVIGTQASAPAIRALLADDDDEIRARACEALARLGDTTAVPQLFALLDDPRPRVALAATAAIHSLHCAETEPHTLAVLRDGSPAARRYALRIVSYLGIASALDLVRAATRDPDARVSELAIATLGTIAEPSVDADLAALLARPVPATRRAAMRAIAQRGTALELLVRGLDDGEAWVRYYACQGLGRAAHVPAVPLLVARLRDPSAQVRLAALEALASIPDPAAAAAVLAAASSANPDERRAALLGMGLLPHEAALPLLLAATTAADPATYIVALSGLARQEGEAAVDALIAAARGSDVDVRDAAVSLLADRADREAADALIDIAADADDPHHPAHAALSQPSAARVAALRARCASADERTAAICAAALGRMRDPRATAALFELLAVPSAISRRIAATVLVEGGAPGARELVARMAREDPDPAVRRASAASSSGTTR